MTALDAPSACEPRYGRRGERGARSSDGAAPSRPHRTLRTAYAARAGFLAEQEILSVTFSSLSLLACFFIDVLLCSW